jgi:membrane protein DedA with SNARE-associated domain
VIFIWVLLEQLGVPVPSLPILMAAGALVAFDKMGAGTVLFLAVFASMISDSIWYQLGHHRGARILGFLCRVSLEPDSCVRTTEMSYRKLGWRALLVAKFIPGASAAAAPMAAIVGMPFLQFLVFDALGALLWAGSYVSLGFIFHHQLEEVAAFISRIGVSVLTVLIFGVAAYATYKYVQRQLFLKKLRIARLHPRTLKQMMDEGDPLVVVDLRNVHDYEEDRRVILGAIRMNPAEIDSRHHDIPRDRDVILYCT